MLYAGQQFDWNGAPAVLALLEARRRMDRSRKGRKLALIGCIRPVGTLASAHRFLVPNVSSFVMTALGRPAATKSCLPHYGDGHGFNEVLDNCFGAYRRAYAVLVAVVGDADDRSSRVLV